MSDRKNKSVIDGPFSPQMENTSKTDAWKAMSAHTRVIYITSVRSRFRGDWDQNNNGKIHPSARQIAAETGFTRNTAARGLREMKHYGFTAETSPAALGVDGKGKAAHWRLTELPYMGEPPTRDFMSWDGTLFDDGKTKKLPRKNKTLSLRTRHPVIPDVTLYVTPDVTYSAETPELSVPTPICEQDQAINGNSGTQKPVTPGMTYLDGSPSANDRDGIEGWQRNSRTPDERLPDDGLDIPTFLRRGHPDCP